MINVIRLGDPTSHGGEVISSAAPHIRVSGIPVALVGDRCSCPIHSECIIVTGSSARHTVDGILVAYHGCETSCGATLIATIDNFREE